VVVLDSDAAPGQPHETAAGRAQEPLLLPRSQGPYQPPNPCQDAAHNLRQGLFVAAKQRRNNNRTG
jgi:hypothetical protein